MVMMMSLDRLDLAAKKFRIVSQRVGIHRVLHHSDAKINFSVDRPHSRNSMLHFIATIFLMCNKHVNDCSTSRALWFCRKSKNSTTCNVYLAIRNPDLKQ